MAKAKVRKILVDADALVALAKADDSNHKRALKIATKLKKDTLFITPFTIPEVSTVISYRVSHKAARIFLLEARKKNLVELPLNFSATKSADEIFLAQKRKGTSWIDCLNAAMVKINFLDGIFSFDKFYSRVGIKLIN